jgi:hypothetical protein
MLAEFFHIRLQKISLSRVYQFEIMFINVLGIGIIDGFRAVM